MVFYRFNHLTQSLKATPAGLFTVTVGKTASGAPKYVYKPLLTVPTQSSGLFPILKKSLSSSTPTQASATTTVSHTEAHDASHDHGHHHGPYISPKFKGWENWKTWRDVPDELIPKTSWRDPDNPIYSSQKFINLRKKQIFYQRPCDLPLYLRGGPASYVNYYFIVVTTWFFVFFSLYVHYEMIYKDFYPDSNLFYFF